MGLLIQGGDYINPKARAAATPEELGMSLADLEKARLKAPVVACMHVYIHMYIYIYIYICKHIYIYTHMHTSLKLAVRS